MDFTTIEAEIDHGRVTVKEPEKLPERGRGILIVLPPSAGASTEHGRPVRVELPLIHGDGIHFINPTREDLDASLWD
ncbi:MAG: hypothetical protein L0211_13295 [Planctomycetaceae bacterium]|nr:hypothetical protein [Planctomycetaceae bacterium]